MMQQPFCRAAKELVLGFVRAVCTQHEAIDGILPDQLLDFDHWATCHHHGFIKEPELLADSDRGLKAFVCFCFKALLQFGQWCIRKVNPCEVRQVMGHVDH